MSGARSARIFVSCGQRKALGETDLAQEIKAAIEAADFGGKHFEAYVASADQSLTNVTAGIFARLDRFEYFLFIDFRREEVIPFEGRQESARYRGSLFVNQELAIAAYHARIPPKSELLAFREDGVEDRGGLLEYAQANLPLHPFKPEERRRLPEMVVEAIRKKVDSGEWNVGWRKELSLRLVVGPPDEANFKGVRPTRYFHVRVANESWTTDATNCRAFLKCWRKLDGSGKPIDTYHSPPPVELKWAGIIQSSVIISPGSESSRDFDAVFIHRDEPSIATIGLNPFIVDSTRVWDAYKLKGVGTYELEFVVRCGEFEPVPITLLLVIGPTLRESRLKHEDSGRSTPTESETPASSPSTTGATSATVPITQYGTIQAIVSRGPYPDESGVVWITRNP